MKKTNNTSIFSLFSRRNRLLLGMIVVATLSAIAASLLVGVDTVSPNTIAKQFTAHHVAIRVPDLEKAVNWYQDVFGASVIRRSQVPNIDPEIEIAMMEINNGFHIELVGGGNPERPVPPPAGIAEDYRVEGYKHVCFAVEDLDRVLAHFREKKVDVFYQVARKDLGVRIALIKDLNRHIIELYQSI